MYQGTAPAFMDGALSLPLLSTGEGDDNHKPTSPFLLGVIIFSTDDPILNLWSSMSMWWKHACLQIYTEDPC